MSNVELPDAHTILPVPDMVSSGHATSGHVSFGGVTSCQACAMVKSPSIPTNVICPYPYTTHVYLQLSIIYRYIDERGG